MAGMEWSSSSGPHGSPIAPARTESRARPGPGERPASTRASTLGALVDALRFFDRGDPGAACGDGDHNRTREARRVAALQHDCLRPEPPRRRTREARRAWPLYDAYLPNTLYLRAHRPEPSPQRLREGRSAPSGRARQAALLRQPLSDAFQVGAQGRGCRTPTSTFSLLRYARL